MLYNHPNNLQLNIIHGFELNVSMIFSPWS